MTTNSGSAQTRAPPPALDFEDSDDTESSSDEEDESVTNVQLGLADGPLEGDDESNPLVSRIGGRAAWLPTQATPPASVAICAHCSSTMELLVQIFAPLEGSPYDRTLLAWGCARPVCQRKGAGSVRVLRHLQYNRRWASKLEKQKARQEAREAKKREQAERDLRNKQAAEAQRKINPFSTTSSTAPTASGNLFGGAFEKAPAFSKSALGHKDDMMKTECQADAPDCSDGDDEEDEEDRLEEEKAMKAALLQTSSKDVWASKAPSYRPAYYLNTVPESSASARAGAKAQRAKLTKAEATALSSAGGGTAVDATADEQKGLEKEGYEKMMLTGMDDVLEKFIARVGAEGRQVVRYEMGGQPLSFSAQGDIYKMLWPKSSSSSSRSTYDASQVPKCEVCGSKRTFELQLMPNLVNTLRPSNIEGEDALADAMGQTNLDRESQRRRELSAALGKQLPPQPSADGITRTSAEDLEALRQKTGLCWSTVFVFVCEKDCCVPRGSPEGAVEGETWREEWVGVQFED